MKNRNSKEQETPAKKNSKQKIVTPPFRAAFPYLFKPQAFQGNAPKYSVTGLFDKNKDLSILTKAIREAKIAKFGSNKEEWPDDIRSAVVDGDMKKYKGREGYPGHWAIKFSCGEDYKPEIVSYPNREVIEDPSEFYPGCWARAKVFARVYEFPKGSKNFGVHFILDHVQKLKDDSSFGGKGTADDAFGAAGLSDEDLEELEIPENESDDDLDDDVDFT